MEHATAPTRLTPQDFDPRDAWAPLVRGVKRSHERRLHGSLPPGPDYLGSMKALTSFFDDPITFYVRLLEQWGDIACVRAKPWQMVVLGDLDLVKDLLVTRARQVRKGPGIRRVRSVLGNGLFTADGEQHRTNRRIAAPALSARTVATYADEMAAIADAEARTWRAGEVMELAPALNVISLRIAGRLLFGVELGDAEIHEVLEASEGIVGTYQQAMLPGGQFVEKHGLAPWARRFGRARVSLEGLLMDVVAGQRPPAAYAAPGEHPVPVRVLLQQAWLEEHGESDAARDAGWLQLRDELMTFLLAGHETVAGALAFVFGSLARFPDVCERAVAEVHDVLGDRLPGAADVDSLPWTNAMIRESMRLNPSVYSFVREPLETWQWEGYDIAPGMEIAVPIAAIHRDARYWPEPDTFLPERFLEPDPDRHPLAFIPFGTGPRICIGNHFAMQQLTIVTATILQRWRPEPVPAAQPIRRTATFTLAPADGLPLTLVPARA